MPFIGFVQAPCYLTGECQEYHKNKINARFPSYVLYWSRCHHHSDGTNRMSWTGTLYNTLPLNMNQCLWLANLHSIHEDVTSNKLIKCIKRRIKWLHFVQLPVALGIRHAQHTSAHAHAHALCSVAYMTFSLSCPISIVPSVAVIVCLAF